MSKRIFILGESGTGKSTSLRNLNSEETFILQCVNKDLPFKGWKSKYKPISKENLNGNRGFTKQYEDLFKQLKYINSNRKDIKNIVIEE